MVHLTVYFPTISQQGFDDKDEANDVMLSLRINVCVHKIATVTVNHKELPGNTKFSSLKTKPATTL